MKGKEFYLHRYMTHVRRVIEIDALHKTVTLEEEMWHEANTSEARTSASSARLMVLAQHMRLFVGALIVRVNEHYTHQEIAKHLGVSLTTVRFTSNHYRQFVAKRDYQVSMNIPVSAFPWVRSPPLTTSKSCRSKTPISS